MNDLCSIFYLSILGQHKYLYKLRSLDDKSLQNISGQIPFIYDFYNKPIKYRIDTIFKFVNGEMGRYFE